MRRKPGRIALAATSILCSLILAACNCAPTLRYVSVAPTSATIFVAANYTTNGETTTTTYVPCTTQQFAATGYYSDGSQKDISSLAGWSSSNTAAAGIDVTGLATSAPSAGPNGATTVITATSGGASATANLAVNVLTAISVTPANATVHLGNSQAYTATGTFTTPGSSITTTMDLTSQITSWTVGNASVASIDSTGLLTTNNPLEEGNQGQGTTTVTASLCGLSGTTNVTVDPPVAASLQISPDSPTIAVGQTLDFTAVEIFTDGSTHPITLPVSWTSDTASVASILSRPAGDGLATGLSEGSAVITACLGSVTPCPADSIQGTTTLTVSPAVARFAYVPGTIDYSVSGYAPNAASGTFTPLGKTLANGGGTAAPQQVVTHPSGMFVYTVNSDDPTTITVFTSDPTTGTLTDSGLSATVAGADGHRDRAVVDPSGRWLYIVDYDSSKVTAFFINQTTGALTAIGSGVATGTNPIDVLLTPDDQFLYVINNTGNSVSAYTIGATGALTAATSPTTVLNGPAYSAIDPTGTYLFVPNSGNNSIVPFTIGSKGAAGTLTAGTAFSLSGASFVNAVAVDPTSKFLYAVDNEASALYALSIGSGGALTSTINSGNPYPVGNSPIGIAVDPTGTIVAVANNADNTLSVFTAASDGSLTPDRLVETGSAPQFPVFANGPAEATVSVAAVVAANTVPGTLSAFTIDSSGVLTPVNTTPFVSVAGNGPIVGTGGWVFTSSASAKELGGYTVDPTSSSATFTQIAAPVTTTGAAGGVIANATGTYVYVADTTNKTVTSHNASTLAPIATASIPGGVTGLASDEQTTLIYALGSNTITPIVTQTNGGSLPATVTGQPFTGTWKAGAVSPGGKFLAAVDSATNKLQVFAITPVTGAGPGTDGKLTAVGTGVSIPGANTVSSVAFDPLGRFLIVTDSVAKTVTPFTISSSGALTAGTALTTPTGAYQAVFDPNGLGFAVAVYGDPAATPAVAGGVQIYQVAEDGTITAVGTPVSAGNGTTGVAGLVQVQ